VVVLERHTSTITNIDRNDNPNHSNYQRYISVMFSTGVRVRHVVTSEKKYIEQVFHPDDYDSVYDDIVVDGCINSEALDEWFTGWLNVIMKEIEDGDHWDVKHIRGDRTASPTNVQFEK